MKPNQSSQTPDQQYLDSLANAATYHMDQHEHHFVNRQLAQDDLAEKEPLMETFGTLSPTEAIEAGGELAEVEQLKRTISEHSEGYDYNIAQAKEHVAKHFAGYRQLAIDEDRARFGTPVSAEMANPAGPLRRASRTVLRVLGLK